MRSLREFLANLGLAAIWPCYLSVLCFLARVAPWPRSFARPASYAIGYFAAVLFIAGAVRFLLGPGRWAERTANLPPRVARQLRLAVWLLCAAALLFLLPERLLGLGLLAPADRPVRATAISRMLCLAFEATIAFVVVRIVRRRSALVEWWTSGPDSGGRLARHRRTVSWILIAGVLGVIVLDAQGYAYTARRVSIAAGQSAALLASCLLLYRALAALIDKHSWRWIGSDRAVSTPGAPCKDLEPRLRRLAVGIVVVAGVVAGFWLWKFDFALVHYLAEIRILPHGEGGVTLGDIVKALAAFTATGFLWRHLDAIFTLAVYPRMSTDPGLRYAVLMLARYGVLALGAVLGLSAIHLGLERIGMVLAALGVGLGFGLQEIVSNFVSGIILLIERPIRVGDIVTVSGMNGRVDRINIRATTIINGDNQSIIVPNREFITANLVNWTHNDRVVRSSLFLGIAYGHDPDAVADLLVTLAHEDDEVLCNPVPSAQMESFGPSTLNFSLHVFVADPSIAGRVKHRLCAKIQRRLAERGIEIPLPAQEFHIRSLKLHPDWAPVTGKGGWRHDPPTAHQAHGPHFGQAETAVCEPEPCDRGVDE